MDISPYRPPPITRFRDLHLEPKQNPTRRSLFGEEEEEKEEDEISEFDVTMQDHCRILGQVCESVKHAMNIGINKFKDSFFVAIHVYDTRNIAIAYCPSYFDGRIVRVEHVAVKKQFVLDCSTGLIGTFDRPIEEGDVMDAGLFQDGSEWKLQLPRGIRFVLTQEGFNPRVY